MTDTAVRYDLPALVESALSCPLCGARRRSAQALAQDIGISYRTLYRFIRRDPVSRRTEALVTSWSKRPLDGHA